MEYGLIKFTKVGEKNEVKKIGQTEVIDFLESCETPVSRKQIADALNEECVKISHIIAKLLKWSEIEFIEYSGKAVTELAGYSPGRRTRFYFVKK